MEQRSSLNITSLFVADYQTMAPPLPQIHYTQAIWLEMGRWPLFVWTREKGERGLGGGQLGEKGDNHQVHSMPICRLVNGLILPECKAAATLTRSLSRQWRENPATGSPQGRGIKAGIEEWAPSLCALVSPKTNASSFLMEALWKWSTLRNRWWWGQKTGGHSSHAHSWSFWMKNRW